MIDKIKALPSKTLLIIGAALILIAIIFLLVLGFAIGMTFNWWTDLVFYFLTGNGFAFMMMAYKKNLKKSNVGQNNNRKK